LKSLLYLVWLTPDSRRTHGRSSGKSAVCGLNGLRPTQRVGTLHLNPRPRSALLLLRPLSVGRFASLRFRPKNMAHHIFQLESELQNIPEVAPETLRSFSVSEKLARYGSSALSGVEHLTLLVGRKSVALALIRHFGSLKGLARASFQELRQFLPRRQAESVVAALSMSVIARPSMLVLSSSTTRNPSIEPAPI
jgi:hypothetical protein